MNALLPSTFGPLGWLPVVVLIALALNGLRLRDRLRRLAVLEPAGGPVAAHHRFVTAAGVELDSDTRQRASAFAVREGLKAVDLVPADFSVGRTMDLARAVDPKTFRGDRLARTTGACHALLVDTELIARAEVDKLDGLDTREMAELTVRLKRFACAETDFAVAPQLRAIPEQPVNRAALLQATEPFGGLFSLTFTAVSYLAIVAGVVVYPLGVLAAVVMFCLQPYLVVAGGVPVQPADLPRFALLRVGLDPLRWARTVAAVRKADKRSEMVAQLRPGYAAELAEGTGRFFEPRRETCPWCGSAELVTRLRTSDLVTLKPGHFTLEQCRACQHVFQNPRLSLAGLDFYYRDVYDGFVGDSVGAVFDAGTPSYRGRAEMVIPFTTPRTWLDVGAGQGHFCNFARDILPDTTFDGLDMSESIDEAARRGWIGRSYRGMFPDLVDDLAGRYDVISMHHYLEHTREPRDEIDAASKVLSVGGFLLIEVPDPESRFGRLLGRLWIPWFQPQHQHMIPLANLRQALAERGFVTVAEHRGLAHQPVDLTAAVGLGINRLVASPKWPWSTLKPTWWRSLRGVIVVTVGAPFLLVAFAGDRLLAPIIRRTQGGNTYRVLARKTH